MAHIFVQSVFLCGGREVVSKVCDVEGVGTCLFYMYNQKIFCKYTRNASEGVLYKCEFVNYVDLLTTDHAAGEDALRLHSLEPGEFGLTMSTFKTKFLVVGYGMNNKNAANDC